MSSEDGRVIRYLKGETVQLSEEETTQSRGWCLVCADGHPLGFARRQNGILKNKILSDGGGSDGGNDKGLTSFWPR